MNQRFFPIRMIGCFLLTLLCLSSVSAQEGSIQEAAQLNAQVMELYGQGRYKDAIPFAQRALAIREKTLGPDDPDTATSLNNLAEVYSLIGAYDKAEPLYQRALTIREKALGPDHPDTAASLNGLAMLYHATGAYDKAYKFYQRALTIIKKAPGPYLPDTAAVLNNLALLYKSTGAYNRAKPLYTLALAIREKALGPDDPDTATSLNNLAELYRVTGAYDQAEPLYQRALAIREKALGSDHPDTATPANNLALLYSLKDNYIKAEQFHQRALAIREKGLGPNHPDTAISLNNLGMLYAANSSYAKAEPLLERAQRIAENNTAHFLLSGSEARKLAYVQQLVGNVDANVSFALAAASPRAKAIALTGVQQYKGRVLDAMTDSVARLRQSVVPQDRALLDELAAVAQEFSTLTFRGPGNLPAAAYRQRLDALAQQQEKLEAELSSRSAAFRQAVTPITLEGVRQALPVDAALVEWFRYAPFDPKSKKESSRWGAPRYVAFVLRRTGDVVAIDLGAAQPIDDLVTEFRTALNAPTHTYVKEVAAELSDKLIKQLRAHLARSEKLLLSPDGALNLVPFAALLDEHGAYLAQRFELTYLTSGRDLLRMAAAAPARGNAMVVADPAYGVHASGKQPVDSGLQAARSSDLDRSGLMFKPLKGAAAEAKALQSLLKLDKQNVLTGTHATEASLKQLHGPRILHIATHGFFLNDQEMTALVLKPAGSVSETLPLPLGENPLLRSGLALAGANTRRSGESDDGILTAAEVAQLDLVGTQLVVLSACDTGVGKVQTGEGVYGLRRALVLAGAQTQLASLWKVADAATQELMVDYYRRLLKGEGRSGALRASQKAMMLNPARQHPYYWAAFVPIGNGSPLPTSR